MARTELQTTGGTTSQTQKKINEAHRLIDGWGVEIAPCKVNRLVRQYESRVAANGWTLFEFMATRVTLNAEQRRAALVDPEYARVIGYGDPTGERAVNEVLRERRR